MNLLRIIVNLFQFNRTNWKAVVLCVVAAGVFWLFNALNQESSANLRFPLYFEFDREVYIPVELPREVSMNVSGNGWDIFRRTIRINLSPLVISLERPTEVRKFPGSTVASLVSGQMSALQINYVQTDTLFVKIEPRHRQKFKVVPDLSTVTLQGNYSIISPVIVLPDSIELEGPLSMIQSVGSSIKLPITADDLDENFREVVEVSVPDESLIIRTPSEVEVIFEVGEIIELEQFISLDKANLPGRIVNNLAMDSVRCILRMPRKYEEDIDSYLEDTRAEITPIGWQRGTNKVLPLILGLPPYTEVVQVDTMLIQY